MSAVKRFVEYALGGRGGRQLSETLAKVGLRGLGVGLPPFVSESGEANFLRTFIKTCGCAVAVDVGAHFGEYTACLLECGANRVVAFEPIPESASQFAQGLGRDPRVTLRSAALGETERDIDLRLPIDAPTSTIASRGEGGEKFTTSAFRSITVQMTTLDAEMERLAVTPDFLKIDVEGYEIEVLAGAPSTIASGKIKAIQIEFSHYNLSRNQTVRDFEKLLPNYLMFRLAARSLRPVDSEHFLGTIYGYSNFVALRPDIARALHSLI